MKNTKNTNEITARMGKFDFSQIVNEELNWTLYDVEIEANEDKTAKNYILSFCPVGLENAVVKYRLFNVDKDGLAKGYRLTTALQLTALGAIKEETYKLPSGKIIKTGTVKLDPLSLFRFKGKTYPAKCYIVPSVINDKQIDWVLIIPENPNNEILEKIRLAISKADEKDNKPETVSFDRLRDSELYDISGNDW